VNTPPPTTLPWEAAAELLRNARRVLLIAHVSPDGDALGSTLALTFALRNMGKHAVPTCQDQPHPRFGFLPGVHEVRQALPPGEHFDLIIALDSSDIARLGTIYQPEQHAALPLLVIDHHITNTAFGTVNVIDPSASSTAEIVFALLKHMGTPITPEIANALLTGVITDTQAFRTSNTTPQTLANAVELMRLGGNLQEITRQALVLRPFDSLRLLGAGLASAQLEERVAYAVIPQKLRAELGVREERGDGGLVGMLISAYEVDIAAVFVELPNGEVEVGLRAQPGFDVAQVAFEMGGGGHPAAAGCTLPGPLREAVNRLLPRLKQAARGR